MTDVWVRWSLVMFGATVRYDVRPGADGAVVPMGEAWTPGDFWWGLYVRASSDVERAQIEQQASEAHAAWVRRPEPPPEGETLDELQARVLRHEGWEAKDVAFALRCTPTFVRRVRAEHERSPETGKPEGSLAHARELLAAGLSLRQVAMFTGIPKSTLHEALDRAA